jgi:hypothetical protein
VTLYSVCAVNAATTKFDGVYAGQPEAGAASRCAGTGAQPTMTIANGAVKMPFGPTEFSGSVADDGAVAASAVSPNRGGPRGTVYFDLKGKIANAVFEGAIDAGPCQYKVKFEKK